MKTAFTKVDITPVLPVQLSGYGKLQVAYKVHDPLYARIFLLNDLLWVQLDLTCFDQFLLDLISKETGFSKDKLIVSAIHTHSAGGGTINTYEGLLKGLDANLGGALNPEYCLRIAKTIGNTIKDLRNDLKETTLKVFKGKVIGLGTDRHDPNFEADEDALILEWNREDKKAMIVRMSCHPTVMNENNLEISADFCGAIEPNFSDYEMVAYVNGSCGDMSTRFTRQESTFKEVERYGKLVSDQIKKIMTQEVEEYKDFEMNYLQKSFTLKVKKVDSIEEAKEKVKLAQEKLNEAIQKNLDPKEIRLVKSYLEGAQNNLLSAYAFSTLSDIDVNVSALKLPGITLIFTPLELFSKLSNPYKQYGFEYVGYTNGYLGYMPDMNGYDQGYYEAFSTPYGYGEAEKFMVSIKEWIENY